MIARSTALALLCLVATTTAQADTVRVKTARGTFLVDLVEPGASARGEGDFLIIARAGGEEVRFRAEAEASIRGAGDLNLTVVMGGKPVATVRRLTAAPSPFAPGPGRAVLGTRAASSAWAVAVSPDGKTVASGHNGSLRVWDLVTRAERYRISSPKTFRRLAFAPDGKTIVAAESITIDGKPLANIALRDAATGAARLETAPINVGLHCAAISPDGKVLVSCSWNEADLRVWDAIKGDQVGTLKGHSGAVGTVVYSPDGKTLASCGGDAVRLWDVDTGAVRSVLRGHQRAIESVAYSADGKVLASGSFDATARVWDPASGALVATIEHDDPVLAVALSADGKLVASAAARWGDGFFGQAPAEVRVSDAATGKAVLTLPEQPNQVFALAFTPDGKSLITASLSGAVIVWDLATFRPAP